MVRVPFSPMPGSFTRIFTGERSKRAGSGMPLSKSEALAWTR